MIDVGFLLLGAAISGVGAVLTANGMETSINGFEVDHPLSVVVASAVVACGLVARAVAELRTVVVATPEGLRVRDLWRTRTWRWDQILDVRAVETPPERWNTFIGPGFARLQRHPVAAYSLGLVATADGTVVALPTFYAAAAGEGLLTGDPPPTDVKVAALRRYREETFGPWPPVAQRATYAQLERSTSLIPDALVALVAPIGLWAVLTLASDDEVAFGWLALMWIVAFASFAWSARRRLRRVLDNIT